MKMRLWFVLGKLIYFLIFVTLSSFIIIGANGYKFNTHTRTFQHTGLIALTTKPEKVDASINGVVKKRKSPIKFTYLLPGFYTVEVQKEGYLPWSKTVYVNSGEAVLNPFVTLFLAEGKTEPAKASFVDVLSQRMQDPPDSELDVRGSEIWVKPINRTYPFAVASNRFSLVSRYSVPIPRAIFLPSKKHILFQRQNELHIIDRDGTNDIVIVTLKSADSTDFAVSNDSKYIIYKDGDVILQKRIQ
jgi:PEGA domain-containing protein